VVYIKTWEDQITYLQMTLTILRNSLLVPVQKKCSFGKSYLDYLGHRISATGLQPNPDKNNDHNLQI